MKELILRTAIWAVLSNILSYILMVAFGEKTIEEALSMQFVWQLLIFFTVGLIVFYFTDRKKKKP